MRSREMDSAGRGWTSRKEPVAPIRGERPRSRSRPARPGPVESKPHADIVQQAVESIAQEYPAGALSCRNAAGRMNLSRRSVLCDVDRAGETIDLPRLAELRFVTQPQFVAAPQIHFLRRISISIDDGAVGRLSLVYE